MMWIVVAIFVVHCVTAFLLSYCFDTAELWKDDDKPTIRTPSIYDLPEECSRHTMNNYINEQIVPAHKYFLLKSEIENMQDREGIEEILVYFVVHIVPTALIGYSLVEMDVMPKILCIILPLIVCIVLSFLAHLIYTKSRLVICSNGESKASMRKRYDEMKERHERIVGNQFSFTEFEIEEEADFNSYTINKHYDYLSIIHTTVKRRYYVKKALYYICGAIYILFIMKTPD